jgi:hypothetical protein
MDLQFLFEQPPIYDLLRQYLDDADMLVMRFIVRGIEPPSEQQLVIFARKNDLKLAEWAHLQWRITPHKSKCKKCRTCRKAPQAAMRAAVAHGSLDIVKWYFQYPRQDVLELLPFAAKNGQLEMFKYLHDLCVREGKKPGRWIVADACKSGSVELMDWLLENGYKMDIHLCTIMAEHGHVQLLGWALNRGVKVSYSAADYAMRNGHMHVLEWLHENKKLRSHSIDYAAQLGRIDILEWMYARGYKPTGNTVHSAVGCGRFDIVKWALERGASWPCNICVLATNRNVETLKWVLDNGAPWWDEAYKIAVRRGQFDMLELMQSRGLIP